MSVLARPILGIAMGSAFTLVLAAGCSLIVPADVPDFKCSGAGTSECPSGSLCDTSVGRCVAAALVEGGDDGLPGDNDAADAPIGDEPSDEGPYDLGVACRFDTDCKSHLCGTSTVLTSTITTGTGPICTQTCCTSSDCPTSFVCFGGGTGGSYCVPAAKAKRTPPASGGKAAGASCTGDPDCRSGLCSNNACLDTCCLTSDCAAPTVCGVASVAAPGPAHDIWACIPAVGPRNPATGCTSNGQCKDNNCVGSPSPVCTPSCCSAASCDSQGFPSSSCAYGTSGSDQLKWCVPTNMSGLPLGVSCTQSFDCQSFYCDPELKKCMLVCCKDSDCGAGQVCRPSAVNTPFLRCVPDQR